jgi:hypothetical protein
MPLSDPALRVLGALIEKARTIPDAYPLSSQGLRAACNQKTARDPVMDLHLQEVEAAMRELRDRGLAATVRSAGDRVPKHRHKAREAMELGPREEALLALLLLRGAQTPGELRTRAERYGGVGDVATVEATLQAMRDRSPSLVENRGRGPGQSQDRWVHTLGADPQTQRPRARPAPAQDEPSRPRGERQPSVAELLERIEALEARVAVLEREEARGA